ncbi:LOW QUALITY PROTEIN: hypothetical protein U9M48_044533 [Paspalum notatum var. saurae]|uniref:Uncharacterized protein n=1 Tax=Paspalum notatum var. saurae TaxID=547442 RepID=A0AAQ3UXB3_PASNO
MVQGFESCSCYSATNLLGYGDMGTRPRASYVHQWLQRNQDQRALHFSYNLDDLLSIYIHIGASNSNLLIKSHSHTACIVACHFHETLLLSRHMAYSMVEASQGSVIRPSPVKPNSSWDIRRSSSKTLFPRYDNGTSNRLPSATTRWPLPATEAQHSSNSFSVSQMRCFLPSDVILCHFLVSWHRSKLSWTEHHRAQSHRLQQPRTEEIEAAMISARRLVQMAKQWQRMAALARKRLAPPTPPAEATGAGPCCTSAPVASKGHCVFYSADGRRFEVPLAVECAVRLLRRGERAFLGSVARGFAAMGMSRHNGVVAQLASA